MSKIKRSTSPSISSQAPSAARREQSRLDWNLPRNFETPRSEYAALLPDGAAVWAYTPSGSFGPLSGSAAL